MTSQSEGCHGLNLNVFFSHGRNMIDSHVSYCERVSLFRAIMCFFSAFSIFIRQLTWFLLFPSRTNTLSSTYTRPLGLNAVHRRNYEQETGNFCQLLPPHESFTWDYVEFFSSCSACAPDRLFPRGNLPATHVPSCPNPSWVHSDIAGVLCVEHSRRDNLTVAQKVSLFPPYSVVKSGACQRQAVYPSSVYIFQVKGSGKVAFMSSKSPTSL